jgi:hypothetical protein
MGMLEQLLGSRSVGAAVVTQFQLRALNALGISLLVLWAFSPLGSQSILRALTSSLESREATSTIAIYDNLHASGLNIRNRWSEGSSSDSGEPANKFNGYLRVLFNAMLMTPKSIKVGPMDQWGNVKIPFLPFVDGNSTEDKDEWQERASGAGIFEDYSSVAGLPVANIAFGNTTFSIESSYVELNCQNVSTATNMTGSVPDMHVQWNGSATAEFANGTWWGITSGVYNSTTSDSYRSWSIALDNFVDGYWYDMENRSPLIFRGRKGHSSQSYQTFLPGITEFWAPRRLSQHSFSLLRRTAKIRRVSRRVRAGRRYGSEQELHGDGPTAITETASYGNDFAFKF